MLLKKKILIHKKFNYKIFFLFRNMNSRPCSNNGGSNTVTLEPDYYIIRLREIDALTQMQLQQGGVSDPNNIMRHIMIRDRPYNYPGQGRTLGAEPGTQYVSDNPLRIVEDSPTSSTDLVVRDNTISHSIYNYSLYRLNTGSFQNNNRTLQSFSFPNNVPEINSVDEGAVFIDSTIEHFLNNSGAITPPQVLLRELLRGGIREFHHIIRTQENAIPTLEELRVLREVTLDPSIQNTGENVTLLSRPIEVFFRLISRPRLVYIFQLLVGYDQTIGLYACLLLTPFLMGYISTIYSSSTNLGGILFFITRTIGGLISELGISLFNFRRNNLSTIVDRIFRRINFYIPINIIFRRNNFDTPINRSAGSIRQVNQIDVNIQRLNTSSNRWSGIFYGLVLLGAGVTIANGDTIINSSALLFGRISSFFAKSTNSAKNALIEWGVRTLFAHYAPVLYNYIINFMGPNHINRLTNSIPELLEELADLLY